MYSLWLSLYLLFIIKHTQRRSALETPGMARHGTLSRCPVKEHAPADMCDNKTPRTTTTGDHNNIPLPALTPSHSTPCPDSDRCDTAGVPVPQQRRSAPAISRFCPTLGWLHLVKRVTHRAAAHVALTAPIVFNVPDMWSRDDDNLLLQTIASTIPLMTWVCTVRTGHLPSVCIS